jgi:hypothetical protein
MALAWEQELTALLQSSEKREPRPACDALIVETDGFIRNSAAEMLLELAEVYGTNVGTVVHGLVLWDRFMSSRCTIDIYNVLRASVACFMISVKLRDTQHPAILDLANLTSFQFDDLVRSEKLVLSSIDWNIHSITGELLSF